jgi:hypothetical protein
MNELKPEDVIKALECCLDFECTECPMNYEDCEEREFEYLVRQSLPMLKALIREKDAEIERLYKGIEELAEESDARDIDDTYARQKIRDEAITEFAERVMGRFNIYDKAMYPQTVVHDVVARIAKEMKEENES